MVQLKQKANSQGGPEKSEKTKSPQGGNQNQQEKGGGRYMGGGGFGIIQLVGQGGRQDLRGPWPLRGKKPCLGKCERPYYLKQKKGKRERKESGSTTKHQGVWGTRVCARGEEKDVKRGIRTIQGEIMRADRKRQNPGRGYTQKAEKEWQKTLKGGSQIRPVLTGVFKKSKVFCPKMGEKPP